MGFYRVDMQRRRSDLGGLSAGTIRDKGCTVCPLRFQDTELAPSGSERPLVYFIADAPAPLDFKYKRLNRSPGGRFLVDQIPDDFLDHVRFGACLRHMPDRKDSDEGKYNPLAVACCRPLLERDIEQTKPRLIVGLGDLPLRWIMKRSGVMEWRGRFIPVRVGSHVCWFLPTFDPQDVLDWRRHDPTEDRPYGGKEEFAFVLDLRKAFDSVEDLPDPVIDTPDDARADIVCVTGHGGQRDVSRVVNYLHSLYDTDIAGVDYETNALRPYGRGTKILSCAVSSVTGAIAFGMDHPQSGWSDEQREEIETALYDFLVNAPCKKVVHNLAFEHEWTGYFFGEDVLRAQPWGCSMVQAHTLDERQGRSKPGPQSLEFLCEQHYGINIKALSPVDRAKLETTDLSEVLLYNGIDAKYHRKLFVTQQKLLREEGLLEVYKQKVRRVPSFVLAQLIGLPLNEQKNAAFLAKWQDEVDEIERDISRLDVVKEFERRTNRKFRPSANDDLKYILTKMLGLEITSVDEKALNGIRKPITRLVLRWRGANKVLSTYIKPYAVDKDHGWPDGRLHPVYNTTKTETDRTSASDPNVQNVLKHDHVEIRSQVDPGGDLYLVSFDYAGIQARNIAMESKDKKLVESFWTGYDIHGDWRERITRTCPSWFPKELRKDPKEQKVMRQRAKNGLVFPAFFGAQPPTLSNDLNIDISYCYELLDEFWEEFPGVRKWQIRLQKDFYKYGYVTGLSGFRRRAPISPNQLINSPIQSDEVLIVCDAMDRLSEMGDPKFQACLMVHDDLTFIWRKKEIERNAEVVIKAMLDVPFSWAKIVPIGVEMSIGRDWGRMHEVGKYESHEWTSGVTMPDLSTLDAPKVESAKRN